MNSPDDLEDLAEAERGEAAVLEKKLTMFEQLMALNLPGIRDGRPEMLERQKREGAVATIYQMRPLRPAPQVMGTPSPGTE